MDKSLFDPGENSLQISLHSIITELSNISELSQLMQLSNDKVTFERYLYMMRELSDNTIRIIMSYIDHETLE